MEGESMIRLKNIRRKWKLTMLFLFVGIVPLAVVGVLSAVRATDSLMGKSYAQLEAVREIK